MGDAQDLQEHDHDHEGHDHEGHDHDHDEVVDVVEADETEVVESVESDATNEPAADAAADEPAANTDEGAK